MSLLGLELFVRTDGNSPDTSVRTKLNKDLPLDVDPEEYLRAELWEAVETTIKLLKQTGELE